MTHHSQFYINGAWIEPNGTGVGEVFDPNTEEPFATVALGDATDVDRAVSAARSAFQAFAATTVAERQALLRRIRDGILARLDDLAQALHHEMGAPKQFARDWQAQSGADHFTTMIEVLSRFAFEERQGETLILREPIGVCGMITPWNWPLNQIACKVAPALAAGCTMILKPSEQAPLDALILADIMHEAGTPAGVFNLVNGSGPGVGAAIAAHPGIDMVSFTGSTRAGIEVARLAAPTVKRVAQELGGNCPNILLDDVNFQVAVTSGVQATLSNAGQSCNSPQRMLGPHTRMSEAAEIARLAAEAERPGPVASARHFAKVQGLIALGLQNGARLITGGPGRPEGITKGWHIRPTIFANVTMDMPIARTEVFGPVLQLIGYEDENDAVAIANDTEYGLAAYVQSASRARALSVAKRLRAGWVEINHASFDYAAPFGGYKQSGNGREYGAFGLAEYLEVKAIMGAG